MLHLPEQEALSAAARELGLPLVLVGGAVRDALAGRPVVDWDFVVPGAAGAETLARAFARASRRPLVVLDAGFGVYRVGGADGLVFDFTRQQAPSLAADLLRRDLTINAIACDLATGDYVDPAGGLADLEAGVIRMVSPEALTADPARLARAYRFAAQFGFALEPETRRAIVARLPLLRGTAHERVLVEAGKWLQAPAARPWALAAAHDGFWSAWLGGEGPAEEALAERWDALEAFLAAHPAAGPLLGAPLGAPFTGLAALRLSLAWPAGARETPASLPVSAKLAQVLEALLGPAAPDWPDALSTEAERRWCFHRWLKAFGPAALPLWAAAGASGALDAGVAAAALAFALAREQAPYRPLLSGQALMAALGLRPGPAVGRWLAEIEERHVRGELRSPEEALAWAASRAQRGE